MKCFPLKQAQEDNTVLLVWHTQSNPRICQVETELNVCLADQDGWRVGLFPIILNYSFQYIVHLP